MGRLRRLVYPGQGKIKLWRHSVWHIDTQPTTGLAEASVSISTGVFHTLAVTFDGSQITVAFNGTDVIQVSDTTYAAGAVALDVSNQPIDFDDVTVSTLPGPPPLFADDFSGGLAGWTPSPLGLFSNWNGASGTASYNGGGHTQIYAGDAQWADYRFEAKVRVTNAADFPRRHPRPGRHRDRRRLCRLDLPGVGKIKLWNPSVWHIDTQPTGILTANMHTDSASHAGSDAIIDSALTRGVPVVTARQMLTWLDGRNGSSFGAITWSGNTLSFTVTAAAGSNGLRGMIPATTSAEILTSLTVGGNPVAFTTGTIKGISYAVFPASTGNWVATYAP